MSLRLLLALTLVVLPHVPQAPQARPAPATIDAVSWLAGAWTTAGGAPTEERWLSPAGGAMLGTSRTIARDRMVAFEFLRIVERDGTLVYVAQPNGRPPTEFTLTSVGSRQATFENPAHDYPKVIAYVLDGDALDVTISDANGERPMAFRFSRLPAGPTSPR